MGCIDGSGQNYSFEERYGRKNRRKSLPRNPMNIHSTGPDPPKKKRTTVKPPSLADFSPNAITKEVKYISLKHWLSLYPVALGAAGGLAALLIDPVFAALAVGGVAISLGSVSINYFFRKDAIADRYIRRLRDEMAQYREELITNLKEDLAACKELHVVGQYAEQGEAQIGQLQKKFDTFKDILGGKLNEGELTYNQYLGTAAQLYLATLDNLRDIVNHLKSHEAIDVHYVKGRLTELAKIKNKEQADIREVEALTESMNRAEELRKSINEILTRNEEAMTDIDQVTAALVTEMKTGAQAKVDFETACKHLEELAKRAR